MQAEGVPVGGADALSALEDIINDNAGDLVLHFKPGKYAISGPWVIPAGRNVSITGSGIGSAMRSYQVGTLVPGMTVIELMASAGTTTAVVKYAGGHRGCRIADIAFFGNGVADHGLYLNRFTNGKVDNIVISAIDGYGLVLATDGASVAASHNTMFNRLSGVTVDQCQYGVTLNGAESDDPELNVNCNACHNVFEALRVVRYGFNGSSATTGGGGLVLDCCDNNSFLGTYLECDQTNLDAVGLVIKKRGRANYFWHLQGPATLLAERQAANIDEEIIGQNNVVDHFDVENGQEVPEDVVGLTIR